MVFLPTATAVTLNLTRQVDELVKVDFVRVVLADEMAGHQTPTVAVRRLVTCLEETVNQQK